MDSQVSSKLSSFQEIIDNGSHIVFFGGAGVSTESGIPDFRSGSGLYNQKRAGYAPEDILHHDFFYSNTNDFYMYYFTEMIHSDARPNNAHKALAALEASGKLDTIITQNIDGLHQQAGSKKVIELHGSVLRNHCIACGHSYSLSDILRYQPSPDRPPSGQPGCTGEQFQALASGFGTSSPSHSAHIPICEKCGGIIKPDVVLYGEILDDAAISRAITAISDADVLIVGGTSLSVYPAAGLVQYFRGNHLVLINRSETPYDHKADLIIRESIAQVFSNLKGIL